jgi:hypothetical protein
MIVAVSRSNIDPNGGIPIGFQTDITTGQPQAIEAPIFNQTLAQTRVTAYDGQTVILGGLITKQRATQSRRIPFLADIPLAGWLFRFDSEVEKRSELLVVMTPRVINYNDPNKLDMIKQVESSRMSWCLADILNIYGDVGLSEGNGLWGPASSPVIYPDTNPTGDVGNTGSPVAQEPTYLTPTVETPATMIPANPGYAPGYQPAPGSSYPNPSYPNSAYPNQVVPSPNGEIIIEGIPEGAIIQGQTPVNSSSRIPQRSLLKSETPVQPAVVQPVAVAPAPYNGQPVRKP